MALIGVYADWEGLDGPARIGYLHSRRTRAREIFEFEYGNDSNLLIVFYVQIMPDDFVMQLHRF